MISAPWRANMPPRHPAVIRVNYGVQRSQNGGMAVRTIAMLPCLIGAWKEVGGGLQLSLSASFPMDRRGLERPELMEKSPLGRPARVVNMSELGKVLNTLADPPVKAVFVYNSNPAVVAPNHGDVVRGFLRPDLFTVVHEQFFTDTVNYADILLPATTFFEHKDLLGSYGHAYAQVSNQAIDPLGECKSNHQLFQLLAKTMGFTDECFSQSEDDMIDEALSAREGRLDPQGWLQGITARATGKGRPRAAELWRWAVSSLCQRRVHHAQRQGGVLYRSASKHRGWIRYLHSLLRVNRGIRRKQTPSRWSCWPAKLIIF